MTTTRKLRQPERGNREFLLACGRMIRSAGRRVADGDVEMLANLVALRGDLDAAIDDAARGLIASDYSATDIGRVLGITRQAAWKRYTRKAVA